MPPSHDDLTLDALRTRARELRPDYERWLRALVEIPTVSADPARKRDVRRGAEAAVAVTPRALSFFVVSTLAACSGATRGLQLTPALSAEDGDPRREMIRALHADGPDARLGSQAELFDRFIGTWDCDFAVYDERGSVARFQGELLFGWVLDGHAVQDVWIFRPRTPVVARDIGTTVRCFDPASGRWRAVWVAASRGYVIPLEGGAEGERIVLRGKDTDGSELRWSFEDIRPDSFTWRGESSRDGGATWWLQELHQMRRRGAGRAEAR